MMSSARDDWGTPDWVIERMRAYAGAAGMPIALDPCAGGSRRVPAREHRDTDGLEPWHVRGVVYCNPPYGRQISRWTGRARADRAESRSITLLVPARTDTWWWHDLIIGADAVAFLRGRLRFHGAPSSAPFPSALVLLDPDVRRRSIWSRHWADVAWIAESAAL